MDATNKAMAAWIWMFTGFMGLFGFLPGLIGHLIHSNEFINAHARNALNFWITEIVFSVALSISAAFISFVFEQNDVVFIRMALIIPMIFWHLFHCIKGAAQASKGFLYCPSFTYRFIKT